MVIPKRIHQLWVGPADPPTDLIASWKSKHPGWEHRLWREDDLDRFGLRHRDLYERAIRDKLWTAASDIARLEIVHRLGGVYVDTDANCLHTLDGAPFLTGDIFLQEEQRRPQPRLVTNAFFGAIPDHPAIGAAVDSIANVNRDQLDPPWTKVGVLRFDRVMKGYPGITTLEPGAFYRQDVYGDPVPPAPIVYADHHFGRRFPKPAVSVLVPFADHNERRTEIWEWLTYWWFGSMREIELVVAGDDGRPFSKTRALNRAAAKASGQVFITLDADGILAPEFVRPAIEHAKRGKWTMPYQHMYRMSKAETDRVLDADPFTFTANQINPRLAAEQHRANRYGAMCMVMPRQAWEAIGHFDERFVGWGQEDWATLIALDSMYGRHRIGRGNIFHLGHKRMGARTVNDISNPRRRWSGQAKRQPNRALLNLYLKANKAGKAEMAKLLSL